MAAKSFFLKGTPSIVLTPGQAHVVASAPLLAGHYVVAARLDSFGADRDASFPASAEARLGKAHLKVIEQRVSATTPGIHNVVVVEDSVTKVGLQEQRLSLSLGVTLTGPATLELSLQNTSSSQNINSLNGTVSGIGVDSLEL
jgi:hypothetical protein